MRRLVLGLLLQGVLNALPLGNPWDPLLLCQQTLPCSLPNFAILPDPGLHLRLGYQGNAVFNRHLEVDRHDNHASIDQTRLMTNAAFLTLNVCRRIDIFGAVGASSIQLTTPASAFAFRNTDTISLTTIGTIPIAVANQPAFDANGQLQLFCETTASCGAGLSAVLWNSGPCLVQAKGQYFLTNPSIRSIEIPTPYQNSGETFNLILVRPTTWVVRAPSLIHPSKNVHFKYHEWEINLSAAYALTLLCDQLVVVPYAALNLSGVRVDMGGASFNPTTTLVNFPGIDVTDQDIPDANYALDLFDLKQQKHWGYTVGVSLVGCQWMSIGVEGHFASEKALAFQAQMHF